MDYPRSHTDPLANLVVLSSLDITSQFREMMERDFPIHTLPVFLHEVTHHWCFDSPVGYALHLLFLKARRAAFKIGLGRAADRRGARRDLLDCVVRYEVALQILRPISEGLALFSEHDAIPGSAKSISTPMRLAAVLYGRGVGVLGPEPWKDLPYVLAAGRLSRQHARRKADLLIQPLTCEAGGYLPGYLLTKVLWARLRARSAIFADSDFFLQFARWQIFDDWALVGKLLDHSKSELEALAPIRDQIASRLDALVTQPDLENRAIVFEKACVDGHLKKIKIKTRVLETEIPYLPVVDDPEISAGQLCMKQAVESLFGELSDDETEQGLMRHDAREITLRALIALGHASAVAKAVPDGLQIAKDGNELIALTKATLDGRKISDGPVEIDVITLSEPGGFFFVFSRDDEVLACVPIGNYTAPKYLQSSMMDRRRRIESAKDWRDLLEAAIAATDLAQSIEGVRRATADALDAFFLPRALARVPDSQLVQTMNLMKRDGLLPVLGNDVGLLIDAASASLCLPSPFNLNEVEGFHRWSTGTWQTSLDKVNGLFEKSLGYAPFIQMDDERFFPISLI